MINEEQSYFRLKESIKGKDELISDIKGDSLIGHGKTIGQNDRVSLRLKTSV